MMRGYPTIRVQIDSMRDQLAMALTAHYDQIKDEVEQQLRETLNRFDIAQYIQKEAPSIIENVLKESIRFAISDAMSYDSPFRATLKNAVQDALRSALAAQPPQEPRA